MNLNETTDYYKSKRILITGAAGFIGSNLLNFFINNSIKVCIVVKPTTNLWRLAKNPLIKFFFADLTNYNETFEVIKQSKPQLLFHIASTGGHPSDTNLFLKFHSTNLAITANLLEASVKCEVEKFIISGSSLEAEVVDNKVFENYSLKPTTFRGITKATETLLCNYYVQNYNLNVINIRIFSVYGPFENSSRVVPQLILRFLKKESVSLISRDYKRDFVYVDDVINCILQIGGLNLVQSGTIVNIGSGNVFSAYDLYEQLCEIFGCKVPVNPIPYPKKSIDSTPFSADLNNIKELLNWRPEHSLKLGLTKTVEWFSNNQAFYE